MEEALKLILTSVKPLTAQKVPLFEAPGRVISEDIISQWNIPPVDNSAMDGYAVIASDTAGASGDTPARIEIVSEIRAGEGSPAAELVRGKCIRIMTGAPVPRGADAVVQFEDTGESGTMAEVFRRVIPGENIRRAGEDIGRGDIVLRKGDRVGSAEMGVLASLNRSEIPVARMPEVAIISTGDEIAEVGDNASSGYIRNSNAYTLYSEVKKYCGIPRYLGIARDSREDTGKKLSEALNSNVILTTGGVSMGKFDFVKDALKELGVEILIENIRMKPGKPCVFGIKGEVLFFGLPGNPVSTMVSFIQFVRPAILRLMGARRIEKPMVQAVLEEDISKKPGRIHFIRGHFTVKNGALHVSTTGPQGSGILRSMSMANCLIVVSEMTEKVKAGEMVTIQLIRHGEI